MTSFPGLLIREWREHRAAFLWSPAIVLALILLAGVSAMTLNDNIEADVGDVEVQELEDKLGEHRQQRQQTGFLEVLTAMTLDVAGSTDAAAIQTKVAKSKDAAFYDGQLKTAEFFVHAILPATIGKMNAIAAPNPAAIDIHERSFGG